MATKEPSKHVFISYVHEDAEQVDQLCAVLEAVNIPYWRDRSKLGPGDEWKVKIREAIRSGSMAFLACFSDQSRAKDKSYMNEELTIATEEWRLRPPGRTWLIPVRFDEGPVPEWDLGAGKTLSDLNYSDLFGSALIPNTAQLVDKIKEVMGLTSALDPRVVQTSVEESTASHRPAILRRLTKEMVRDPSRDIELDDLVSAEIARALAGMRDSDRFPTSSPGGSNSELAVHGAVRANDYWELVQPFCWSLQVAARYGEPSALSPWSNGMRALSAEAHKIAGGHTYLLNLRHVPALITVFVAAMSAAGQGKWSNFKALVVDPKVTDRSRSFGSSPKLSLVEAVNPYKPFDSELISQLLVNAWVMGKDLADAQEAIDRREGMNYHTPVPDWLHRILRRLFDEQFPDDEEYDDAFDRTEVILGVVDEDLANERFKDQPTRPFHSSTMWFGRAGWRSKHDRDDPVRALADELAADGSGWPPLGAGLFGGSVDRANTAISQYHESFAKYRSNSRFW
ncbi:toll/interleukin-1 receptor domain-containing protein [Mycobacterium sp. 1245805.9]|uniref:toll/interleukin-1 receptor domain-containing protein n=1 Tax=Mycobacterium sp. 1245805.9 TaxID=1856862 RepID=UPI0009EF6B59|nr:toll/interleukin-1 receptor domain-containing protein [Mycobacterium sp. 1245805.9]